MSWQTKRSMNDAEFRRALKTLQLSRSAAARFLGLGPRTIYRYCEEGGRIAPSVALLLNAMVELQIKPIVPPCQRKLERWREP